MDLFILTWIGVLSCWLAYINYVARIKKSEYLAETNPLWAVFDKLGLKKFQFLAIPAIFLGLGYYFSSAGNEFSLGILTGILFLNTFFDAMTLTRFKTIEGSSLIKKVKKSDLEKKINMYSFIRGFLSILWLYLLVMSYFIIFGVSVGILGMIGGEISVTLGHVWVIPLGIIFAVIGLKYIIDFDALAFKKSYPLPKDDGISRKTELSDIDST